MSKKFLSRVIAGAALGGVSLLVCAPAAAMADGPHDTDGHHKDDGGHIFSKPQMVKPGHEVKIVEICKKPQEHPWAWSMITGKLDLAPKHHKDDKRQDENDKERKDFKEDEDYQKFEDFKRFKQAEGFENDEDSKGREEFNDDKDYKNDNDYQEFKKYQAYLEYRVSKEDKHENSLEELRPQADTEKLEPIQPQEPSTSPEAEVTPIPSPEAGQPETNMAPEAGQPEANMAPEAGQPEAGIGGMFTDDNWNDKDDEDGKEHFAYWTSVKIPQDAKPGHYKLTGSCANGELIVLPNGWVDGGDGGATDNSNRLAAGGAGLLGAAALGGIVLMRRRRINESLV